MQSKHVFIGDYSGQITMLKVEETGYKPITTLKGHSGWEIFKFLPQISLKLTICF